jgi:hypothetical protein
MNFVRNVMDIIRIKKHLRGLDFSPLSDPSQEEKCEKS